MKTCNREVLKKVYQKFGSTADFNLTGDYKYLKGLGPYETFKKDNERNTNRYLFLPKMQLNLKRPVRFENMECPSDEIRRKNLLGLSWQARSYVNGMSPVTSECLSGQAYTFEGGLRIVDPYFNCLSNTASEDKYPGANIQLADYFTIRFPTFTRRYFEILIEQKQIVGNTYHVMLILSMWSRKVMSYLTCSTNMRMTSQTAKLILFMKMKILLWSTNRVLGLFIPWVTSNSTLCSS